MDPVPLGIGLGPLPPDLPPLWPAHAPADPVAAVRRAGGAARSDSLGRLDERALRKAIADGVLVWGRRKVLALAGADLGLVAAVELRGTLVEASAAAFHGLALLEPPGPPRVAVPLKTSRRQFPGVLVVHRDVPATTLHDGLPVLNPLATVVSCALALPFPQALVVANDAAYRRLITADGMLRAARELPERSALPVRRIARLVDPRYESLLETQHFLAARAVGARIEPQVRLGGVGWVDSVLDGWLVSEADGYESHSSRSHYRHDRRRMRVTLHHGYPTVRWSYEDLVVRWHQTCDELRAILASGPQRRSRPRLVR